MEGGVQDKLNAHHSNTYPNGVYLLFCVAGSSRNSGTNVVCGESDYRQNKIFANVETGNDNQVDR